MLTVRLNGIKGSWCWYSLERNLCFSMQEKWKKCVVGLLFPCECMPSIAGVRCKWGVVLLQTNVVKTEIWEWSIPLRGDSADHSCCWEWWGWDWLCATRSGPVWLFKANSIAQRTVLVVTFFFCGLRVSFGSPFLFQMRVRQFLSLTIY